MNTKIISMKISASIVTYNTDEIILSELISDFFENCKDGTLYIVDNSELSNINKYLIDDPRIIYIKPIRNIGFGAGHNAAIRATDKKSDIHFIINPDIRIPSGTISSLANYLWNNNDVGAAMPAVRYPDGSAQNLCKLLPTPLNLIIRRFIPIKRIRDWIDATYIIKDLPTDRPTNVPLISGCFFGARTDLLNKIGGFDERYFLYMEDFDLFRRIGELKSITFYPMTHVIHGYAKGSYRNIKLLKLHTQSAISYFNKWGWLLDSRRKLVNAPYFLMGRKDN